MYETDVWSGLADFLANMIEKYAEQMDLDALPDPRRISRLKLWKKCIEDICGSAFRQDRLHNNQADSVDYFLRVGCSFLLKIEKIYNKILVTSKAKLIDSFLMENKRTMMTVTITAVRLIWMTACTGCMIRSMTRSKAS